MGLHYLFVDNPAAIGEEWQSIEHREQYVASKISFSVQSGDKRDASL